LRGCYPMTYGWAEMIADFHRLGGRVQNIFPRGGPRGRGIFPIDPTHHTYLRVPESLLVSVEDIAFEDGRLKVVESAEIGAREREFFERYQNAFSWGGNGRSDSVAFLAGLKSLGPEAISVLERIWGRTIAEDSAASEQWFLQSRSLHWKGRNVVAPVLDLVNHEYSAQRHGEVDNGIAVGGMIPDEVLMRYDEWDPFSMFMRYGFASPEDMAFSMPLIRKEEPELVVGNDINLDSKHGALPVPKFMIESGRVALSSLMIGSIKRPRVPKSIFVRILKEAGARNPEEGFDHILHLNRMAFLALLELVETQESRIAASVRKMIRFQLQAISHSYGSIEAVPAA